MAVPTTMADLSVTANSNSPAGSESPISTDDFLRAIQSILRHTSAKGADIASATTTDIGAATGEFVDVTGTTTITGLGTIAAGIERTVRFTGALTLTHNATSLILPGGANITTAANDRAVFRSLGSGNWICIVYQKASGAPLDNSVATASLQDYSATKAKLNDDVRASEAEYQTGTAVDVFLNPAVARAKNIVLGTAVTASGTSIDYTSIPPWVKSIKILFASVSTNGSVFPRIQLGDAGGFETTGYVGAFSTITTTVSTSNFSSGFDVNSASAGNVLSGAISLSSIGDSNLWCCEYSIGASNGAALYIGAGRKALSDVLTQLRITTANGTDTFDGGSINILYS